MIMNATLSLAMTKRKYSDMHAQTFQLHSANLYAHISFFRTATEHI